MRILFVDDRPSEVIHQWQLSGCTDSYELLPVVPFESIEQVRQQVAVYQPHVIVIGYGLGQPAATGADVVRALYNQGYRGYIVANSGGGPAPFIQVGINLNGSADRDPAKLKETLKNLNKEEKSR